LNPSWPLARVFAIAGLAIASTDCRAERGPGERPLHPITFAETLYDGGLQGGWEDYGWAPRTLSAGAPAEIDFSGHGGWILARPAFRARVGDLTFRFRARRELGDFLEVRLESLRTDVFPRVRVAARHRADQADGWSEVVIAASELNPSALAFDRVVLRAYRAVEAKAVLVDQIGFAAAASPGAASGRTARTMQMSVSCGGPVHPISPAIYGVAYDPRLDHEAGHVWDLGIGARRWGGNPASRYNWELGHAWNTANDWFYQNVNYTGRPDFSYDEFLEANRTRGIETALTVPILGWVARDTESYSFPVALVGSQQAVAPERPDAGNGISSSGKPIGPPPPARTSIAAAPEMIGRWVAAIRAGDVRRGARRVASYILDNEPMLWNSTHRDVHPEPTSYDELLERTITYGTAVRANDPDAVIAGPAEWGWPAYFFSGVDAEAGFRLKPDRRKHGDVPLLPWYLQQLREHERRTGVRILDVVDVHFYPMADGVGGAQGGVAPAVAAKRIRSTRALWDPSYRDESWIDEPVRLFPRLKEWIDESYPGRGISIGEWNFGAETHMSGGLAAAEALGRFGEAGIHSAFYWTYPPPESPAAYAFRAFRNYDGRGGRFLDFSVRTRSDPGASFFASVNEARTRVVAVALNLDPEIPADVTFSLGGCGQPTGVRRYTYDGGEGFAAEPPQAVSTTRFRQVLPPYSINVLEISLRDGEPSGYNLVHRAE
jgi:hypothetical protein